MKQTQKIMFSSYERVQVEKKKQQKKKQQKNKKKKKKKKRFPVLFKPYEGKGILSIQDLSPEENRSRRKEREAKTPRDKKEEENTAITARDEQITC